MTMTQPITLSEQQQAACDRFAEWYEAYPEVPRKFFVLQGFAGTGKSFTVNHIMEQLELAPVYMTYTGKAALVLQKYSKLDARTIHSTCYRYIPPNAKQLEELYDARKDASGEALKDIDTKLKQMSSPKFEFNPHAFEEDPPDVIVLDECSMVDEDILNDLLRYEIPIMALGDSGQLRPVHGTGALFTGPPDAELTEIRRQALQSPIVDWSMRARTKKALPPTDPQNWRNDEAAKISVGIARSLLQDLFDAHDIAICWKNATRQSLNSTRRQQLGFHGTYPRKGERLQIIKNDKEKGLFNGQFADVVDVGELTDYGMDVIIQPEGVDEPMTVSLMRAMFDEYFDSDAGKSVPPWEFRKHVQADFGYAITCHKAQGSQWDNVLIFEENVFGWNKPGNLELRAEWLYTAITRAVKKLTLINGKW